MITEETSTWLDLLHTHGFIDVAGSLRMAVKVEAVRQVYGRIELQVVPAYAKGGSGSAWVQVGTFKRETV